MQHAHSSPAAPSNLYDDATLYNRISAALERDVEELTFYSGLVQHRPWKVAAPQWLELGCGSGRLTLQLAALGHAMTGIDNSASMLQSARDRAAAQHQSKVQWHLQDVRRFKLGEKYHMMLLPSNNLAHLHSLADLQGLLHSVQQHLLDDGLFVIDYFNPSVLKLALGPGQVFPLIDAGSAADPELAVTETSLYDPATQTSAVCWRAQVGQAEPVSLNFTMRIWYPQELDALLQLCGMTIVCKFGHYQGQPFDAQSPRQLLVCRRGVTVG